MPDKLLELKNDLVFQEIFGKQKNCKITAHLLSLILKKEIHNIDLDVNKRMLGNKPNSKTGRLDIRVKFNNGEDCYIEPPLRANWGGHHVHFGKRVYANFNLTLVDDTHIYVGDYTMIGPNVTIATAGHPILPELREKNYQYNIPVHIGKNCWLGAGVIVLPGVTIGDNTVIGAGSIVTKDIPANVVAVGNPCRVLREINERDREYYFKDRKIQLD